jgi:thiamine-phosphate pyrophosphorylase
MRIKGFYFITDRNLSKKDNIEDVKAAIKGGARIVQYREKEKTLIEFLAEVIEIKKICAENNTTLIINDSVAACLLANADGVHLGQDDMPLEDARRVLGKHRIIGITVHNVEEALLAEKQGADYLGVSPIYETKTKKDAGKPAGLGLLREIKKKTRLPCVAIGGINERNVDEVIKAGADAWAAISATVAKEDAEKAVKFFTTKS